jgi:hypothetical protein
MRLELAGSMNQPPPLAVKLMDGIPFVPQQYIDMGYTYFDVIAIGAGGGMGGGIDTGNTGTAIRSFGGAGGGGGLHRVRGLLAALPPACPVVVGLGGNPGSNHVSDPAQTTDGGDGGYSSFNDATCRASGGRGGQRAQSNSLTISTQAAGGQGGAGDRVLAGGGALGGSAGTPSATGPGTAGTPGGWGAWDGTIGEGGGGGAGGVGTYSGITANAATIGGHGSWDPGDTSVYGPGTSPAPDLGASGAASIKPGGAGGAKATPLNSLPTLYGRSFSEEVKGEDGYVVILVTAE